MSERDPVKGASRTLDLLEVFTEAQAPMSLTELAQRTGIPLSSCHALVRTLQTRGYLYMAGHRLFYPTRRLTWLAEAVVAHDPILHRVRPLLERLSRTSGETAILGKMHGERVIYLDLVEPRRTVRYSTTAGETRAAHSSAIGKAALSFLENEELRAAIAALPLAPITENTIVSAQALEADILQSRADGYFVSRGETVSDVMGIAIARKIGGEPFGIGIAGPIFRMEPNAEAHRSALREAALEIERLDRELSGNSGMLAPRP